MSHSNPQIEEQLDKLADICCQSLEGEQQGTDAESEALLKSLLMSGYARKEGASLQADVEARVKDRCKEPAMHRGGELSGITKQFQEKFNELARWESRQPDDDVKPKSANISSSTDA